VAKRQAGRRRKARDRDPRQPQPAGFNTRERRNGAGEDAGRVQQRAAQLLRLFFLRFPGLLRARVFQPYLQFALERGAKHVVEERGGGKRFLRRFVQRLCVFAECLFPVDVVKGLAGEALGENLHQVHLGAQVRHQPLQRAYAPGQHRDARGHRQRVLFSQVQHLLHQRAQVHLPDVHAQVFAHHGVHVGVKRVPPNGRRVAADGEHRVR
jgi:hypothetical protein